MELYRIVSNWKYDPDKASRSIGKEEIDRAINQIEGSTLRNGRVYFKRNTYRPKRRGGKLVTRRGSSLSRQCFMGWVYSPWASAKSKM